MTAELILSSQFKQVSIFPIDLPSDQSNPNTSGSDTTSTVIIYLLFLVISNKHAYERLREELDANFSDPDEPISISALASLPYLNAVVNEALRLGSPFPGWPRVTPKGGMVIADTYIPGEMIVGVNPYVQGTSGENFYPDPTAYKPERWLPGGLGPGTLTRKSAIMSFSFGKSFPNFSYFIVSDC